MALAIIMRSPNSWVTSLMYGVSPQPAQAPENSNSGWRNWLPLTVLLLMLHFGIGQLMAKFQLASPALMLGCQGLHGQAPFALAGQTSAQLPQPVQSRGDTCMRNL